LKTRMGALVMVILLKVLWGGLTPAAAQGIPVGIMPFAGDDAAINQRIQDAALEEARKQEGFGPRVLNTTETFTDYPPEGEVVTGTDYVLTGEYYFDDEDSQHFQAWLWNSGSGALVYTDELVADTTEEAEGYLPALVRWVFSKITPVAAEEPAEEPEEEPADETGPAPRPVERPAGAARPAERPADETAAGEKPPFPRLYAGLWGGGTLDFQTVRPSRNYEGDTGQSFSGAGAVTVEYRPWRYLSFQAEAFLVLESFAPFRLESETGLHTSDRYEGMYLLLPLLVKGSFELDGLRLSPLAGLYYILPLSRTMDGVSYEEKVSLPLGIMAGLELGYSISGGKWGEVYGGLRYGSDLGLTNLEEQGLRYSRSRLIFTLGWRFGFFKK
jgi:hypothetical protein